MRKLIQKNRFGYLTWETDLGDNIFKILIHETNELKYLVEFQEYKWLTYKTQLTFVSDLEMDETIVLTFNKIHEYFQNSSAFEWTLQQKNNLIFQNIRLYRISQGNNSTEFRIINKPGEYVLQLLKVPELMPWGKYQIHYMASTPIHLNKRMDDSGKTHNSLFLEVWCKETDLLLLGQVAKCKIDLVMDINSSKEVLTIVGVAPI